jgi:alpha-tubulin suppressor-like RCC1 family protein
MTAIGAGSSHSCGVRADGKLFCWGEPVAESVVEPGSGKSRLGRLIEGLPPVAQVDAGTDFTCVRTVEGAVWCWGANDVGQLGDGTTEPRLTPQPVDGLTNVTHLAVGDRHVCVVAGGILKCWGDNLSQQLGISNLFFERSLTPITGPTILPGIAQLEAGERYTCVRTTGGAVRCWGANDFGQLGRGFTNDSMVIPSDVQGLAAGAIDVAAGSDHACAVLAGGAALCWGRNVVGQLGNNSKTQSDEPVAVIGLSGPAFALDAGSGHTCARLVSGGVQCWGWNISGQMGDGSKGGERLTAGTVPGVDFVTALALGNYHSCALRNDGYIFCWGMSQEGQAGVTPPGDALVATLIHEGFTCHALALSANMPAALPVASPSKSSFCPPGHFRTGAVVTLTANPPAGHVVAGWTGPVLNQGAVTVTTVNMGAADVAVGVQYKAADPVPAGARILLPIAYGQ